ncbi:HlyD family efflux transporter periplasmic adaptor subunit [Bradyrhizobium sp. CCBAU 11361]|uniref:HlyD family efflux transporter periplasmic adaptor subunit n=1 Tax=Bradyrhizobium sp. CCBAU 11361 TaxID=1630812 RepID=UPI0023042532|nr:HlyD family efflux transporter periplasmic adaptor subunit [Bradyrhizobium sp. CCBAU 11361]MDA9489517.1 hypothetical protein [Bradyrhizobium sp. CCBAU 11361]
MPDAVGLEIECYIANRDIGFVHQGQAAVVKIESLPFTRYGTVDATLLSIQHDAIPEPDATQTEEIRSGRSKIEDSPARSVHKTSCFLPRFVPKSRA